MRIPKRPKGFKGPRTGPGRQSYGKEQEKRFHRALNHRTPRTPDYFLGAEEVTQDLDGIGLDSLVKIRVPGHRRAVKVPIQIKSSWYRAKQYRIKKRPKHVYSVVIIIIVKPYYSDEYIRIVTFQLLEKILHRDRQFNWFYGEIMKIHAKAA